MMDYFVPGTIIGKGVVAVIALFFGASLFIIVKFISKLRYEKSQLDQLELNINLLKPEHTIEKKHFNLNTNLDDSWVKNRIDNVYETVRRNGKIIFEDLSLLQDNKFVRSGIGINFFMGSLVVLGLLGTFLGLISSLNVLEASAAYGKKAEFVKQVSDILSGMKMAFSTTIDGIIGTLVLGGINTVRKNKYVNFVEKFDTITVSKVLPQFVPADSITELNSAAQSLKVAVVQITEDAKILTKVSENIDLNQTNLSTFVENFRVGTENITDYQKTVESLLIKIEDIHSHLKASVDKSNETGVFYSNMLEEQNNRLIEIASHLSKNEDFMKALHQKIVDQNQTYLNNVDKLIDNQQQQADILNNYTEAMDSVSDEFKNSIKVLSKFIERQQEVLDKLNDGRRMPGRNIYPPIHSPEPSGGGNGADSFFAGTEFNKTKTSGRKSLGEILTSILPWMKGR